MGINLLTLNSSCPAQPEECPFGRHKVLKAFWPEPKPSAGFLSLLGPSKIFSSIYANTLCWHFSQLLFPTSTFSTLPKKKTHTKLLLLPQPQIIDKTRQEEFPYGLIIRALLGELKSFSLQSLTAVPVSLAKEIPRPHKVVRAAQLTMSNWSMWESDHQVDASKHQKSHDNMRRRVLQQRSFPAKTTTFIHNISDGNASAHATELILKQSAEKHRRILSVAFSDQLLVSPHNLSPLFSVAFPYWLSRTSRISVSDG